MPLPPFALLLLDAASHELLLADGPSGKIRAEIPLPKGHAAVDLVKGPLPGQVLIPLAGDGGTGLLCQIDLFRKTAEILPLALPHPAQFAPAGDGLTAYMADPAGVPHAIDLAAGTVHAWDKPVGALACVGLATDQNKICGVWETDGGGLFAAYTPAGELVRACRLGGVPTGLTAAAGSLVIPFAASAFSGEGVILLSRESPTPPVVITILCSRCAAIRPAYPAHAAAAPDGQTVYVACEDSAAVAVVDLPRAAVTGVIGIGRSVSRLAVTADGRFAVAASNANADLCLIDLVNRRPLSFTATPREILGPLLIID